MPTARCCCGPCLISSDDFNRADSNPPSGNWIVVDGEWEIASNRLRSIEEGPIVTTIRQDASSRPNSEYSIRVYFKALNLSEGASFGVICGYIDENNFSWVRFDAIGGSVYPTFYNRSGGSDALVMDITTHPAGIGFPIDTGGGQNTWEGKVCYSETDWTVDSGTSEESGYGIQSVGSEHPWTVGTEGGQDRLPSVGGMVGFLWGEFDNWAFHKHWEAKSSCDYCSCLCINPNDIDDYIAIPEILLVTFVPQFDPLDYPCSLNNATVQIHQVTSVGEVYLSPTKRVWSNENIEVGDGTPADAVVTLRCHSAAGTLEDRFTLSLKIPSTSGSYSWGTDLEGGVPFAYVDWDLSTCDPINLVFGDLAANSLSTCETIPGGGPYSEYGYKFPLCVGDGCLAPQTPELEAFLYSLRWKLVVTEP